MHYMKFSGSLVFIPIVCLSSTKRPVFVSEITSTLLHWYYNYGKCWTRNIGSNSLTLNPIAGGSPHKIAHPKCYIGLCRSAMPFDERDTILYRQNISSNSRTQNRIDNNAFVSIFWLNAYQHRPVWCARQSFIPNSIRSPDGNMIF